MSIVRDLVAPSRREPEERWGGLDSLLFGGIQYPLMGYTQTLNRKVEDIDSGFESLVARAYGGNGIVFAVCLVRMMLFTEARFGYQNMRGGMPGDFYGDRDRPNSGLALLDHPWPGGTTGDLLKYVITDADLAGNSFTARRNGRLIRLRPDWTQIVHGTPNPDGSMWDPDAELLGYIYQPGGSMYGRPPVYFSADEVAHFAPIPDPDLPLRGMTWMRAILPEIMSDEAMTQFRLRFFENGATPSLIVKTTHTDLTKFREWIALFRQEHEGARNAARTMFLNAGVDAQVAGANLSQIEFRSTQGAGEVRIANAGGVPATVVGLSEGLAGSSLNAGNFASAMRRFADLTMSPLWRNVSGSLERIIPPPTGARLWYDIRGIPALKDDIKDAAAVQAQQAQAIRTLTDGGFEPASVIDAITSGDLKRLVHSGLLSVQLTPPDPNGNSQPSTEMPMVPSNGKGPMVPAPGGPAA